MPFVLEWLVLVLPLSLALTVYADAPGALSALLLAPTCVLLLLPRIEGGLPLFSTSGTQLATNTREGRAVDGPKHPTLRPLAALTTYRANMMLITVFSILAVDFPIFPRSLAKCETYGVSLVSATPVHMPLQLTGSPVLDGLRSRLVCFLSRHRLCDTPHQGSISVTFGRETQAMSGH